MKTTFTSIKLAKLEVVCSHEPQYDLSVTAKSTQLTLANM